jgi:hypothetical protein
MLPRTLRDTNKENPGGADETETCGLLAADIDPVLPKPEGGRAGGWSVYI